MRVADKTVASDRFETLSEAIGDNRHPKNLLNILFNVLFLPIFLPVSLIC